MRLQSQAPQVAHQTLKKQKCQHGKVILLCYTNCLPGLLLEFNGYSLFNNGVLTD